MPAGWVEADLGEIADTALGKMLSAKAKLGVSPRPYLRNKNVQWGRIDVGDLLEMDFDEVEWEFFRLRAGDLLVCEGGEVGRAAIWRGDGDVGFQKALHRIRPLGGVLPSYLLYALERMARANGFERYVTGSTIKHLPQEDLRSLPMPLPPLAEQRRIVAAIEEQFSRLDAVGRDLTSAHARLGRMPALILQEAFRQFEEHVPLREVADVRLGRQRSPKNHLGPNMTPYLRAANVTWSGLDLSDVKSMNFTPNEVTTYRLEPGDVLLSEASGSAGEVGKAAIWRQELDVCCFQNTLIRVRSQGPLPEFLRLFFLHAAITGQFAQAAPGVGIHHLGAGRLAAWPVPVATESEQAEAVASLEQRLSLIDSLRTAVELAQKRSDALRRAILERAFRGELVPQDPDDEPASVLLERIRAERAAAPKPTRRKRVPA
ncbi:MAG: restriction endonuclease subunit S [Gaiellaceae bacterium]